jgi:hypothetical protein
MFTLYHAVRVSSHVSLDAGVNYFPWTEKPERNMLGWRAVSHFGEPDRIIALRPDLDAPVPTVEVVVIHDDGGTETIGRFELD